MEELAEQLKKYGVSVVDMNLVMLACVSGVFAYQEFFPSKKIVPAFNTVDIGARDGQGNLFVMMKI